MAETERQSPEAASQALVEFMGRWKDFLGQHQHQRAQSEIEVLKSFNARLAPILRRREAFELAHAPDYNIFEVLAIRHYEARVHTPFLVNLLDPRGSHRQGDLFYRSFVREVLREGAPFTDSGSLEVVGEYAAGYLGRIDILIRNRSHTRQHCIIIENKIYAADQAAQLARYDEFARTVSRYDEHNYRLLYLTLHPADRPSDYTLDPTIARELRDKKILRLISYREDILPWLTKHYKEDVHLPAVVRETLKQYLITLKHLVS